ncbi:hypothetical protein D1178_09295 [Stenotrophomonas maltophilia]|jgi:hypothetical protein|nr:hypothetical protein D1178_09295 [Stenotrophomonas maltophilia]MBA0220420.1 hypothetical protein [Stenotrophomonas maltophilia]QGL74968.1 hypothetical protein FEO95_04725 [Stenotrophomonas maltophilia]
MVNRRPLAFNDARSTLRLLRQASLLVLGLLILGGCNASERKEPVGNVQEVIEVPATQERARMWMTIGEHRFSITLADTDAARAFAARLPLTFEMAELNGNEKHVDLPQALPTDASHPGTIRNGDLMLYGSKTVVLFYETFRSSYSYTPLGHVNDPHDLGRVLGHRSSRVAFSE